MQWLKKLFHPIQANPSEYPPTVELIETSDIKPPVVKLVDDPPVKITRTYRAVVKCIKNDVQHAFAVTAHKANAKITGRCPCCKAEITFPTIEEVFRDGGKYINSNLQQLIGLALGHTLYVVGDIDYKSYLRELGRTHYPFEITGGSIPPVRMIHSSTELTDMDSAGYSTVYSNDKCFGITIHYNKEIGIPLLIKLPVDDIPDHPSLSIVAGMWSESPIPGEYDVEFILELDNKHESFGLRTLFPGHQPVYERFSLETFEFVPEIWIIF